MNASQLVQQIIDSGQLEKHVALIEELAPAEANALVPHLVQAFDEYKLWPKDAACIISVCRPTDEQLLDLLQQDCERSQKLGLHIVAMLIDNESFQQGSHKALAQEVFKLLRAESFRPKRKDLKELQTWAESNAVE
ncbi:hypothetical protein [Bremerella sp. P1]|uniref:hypothetical protein n=1 Tax=Bremerella sp. P1 TaxID=3026424 RepID=UPI002367C3D1|nr:hypothetical protein [Bremerella sp. P1]WDI41402.1 hypothetical protein PSR63_23320 [Bremerella sp. P1]